MSIYVRRSLAWLGMLLIVGLAACNTTPPDSLAAAERTFTIYCAGCHSLDPQGQQITGPTVAMMLERARTQSDPAAWLRAAILSPDSEIAPGYNPGLMPSTYAQSFSQTEIDAIVQYILKE